MKGGKSKSDSRKAEPKLGVTKKAAAKPARNPSKKAAKDPDKPKRPASAFFVFMEDFRKKFNEENPKNKQVSAVGKAAGKKWKSMSEADKAPYVAMAEKRKLDYEKEMKAYNKKQAAGAKPADKNESEKSASEVNDDEEDGSGKDDEDDEEEEEDEDED